jgi:predicted GNAT family acetyltransferase
MLRCVARFSDASEFLSVANPFLSDREAAHNLILGLSGRLAQHPRRHGSDPYFALVEQGKRIVAAAMRTPPHNLLLSVIDDLQPIEALAADVHQVFETLPGVLGPVAAAAHYIGAWHALTGSHAHKTRAERIYQAASAIPPSGVPGLMRRYAESDRELVETWFTAFLNEALPGQRAESATQMLDRRLNYPQGGIAIWDDQTPVSVVGFGDPTPNGIRVGPLYTPPALRRRGAASALVAAATSSLLRTRRFCFLYTDLANPTSNSIYQRIGYQPVLDVDQWAFALVPTTDVSADALISR